MNCLRCSRTTTGTARCVHCGFQLPGFALGLLAPGAVEIEAPEAFVEVIEAVADKIDRYLTDGLGLEVLQAQLHILEATLTDLAEEVAETLDETLHQERLIAANTTHQASLRLHLERGTNCFGEGLDLIGRLLEGHPELAEVGLEALRLGGDHLVAAARILGERHLVLESQVAA